MARIEIYIDGQLADYDKVDLSFVYSVEDDDSLSVSGSYSKRSIKLPATKRNNRIFGNAIELQQPQNLNTKLLSLPSRIIVDGLPLFIGHAQVDKATINKYAKTYEVIFLADNSDWIEQLRDVGMDAITLPSTIDYTGQNVVFFYSAYNNFNGFCFFVPKTAEWQTVGNVRTDEFYPAIFIDYIFRKAFDNLGYTIKSDFFETDLWRGLIVPVLQRNYDTKYLKTRTFVTLSSAEYIFLSPSQTEWYVRFNNIVDNSGQQIQNPIGFATVFRPAVNGKYKFTGYFIDSTFGRQGFEIIYPNNPSQFRPVTDPSCTIDLKVGDEVFFVVHYTGTITTITYSTLEIEYLGLVSTPQVPNVTIGNYYPHNALYEPNQLCSKWKILDIIADIQKIYNLVFVTDPSKKEVSIEPRDYWVGVAAGVPWNGNGLYTDNKDITDKLDINKEIEYQYNPDNERYIEFSYKDDDLTCKGYEENREGLKLYAHKFDRGSRFKTETKEVKLNFFNKCFHIVDSEINPNTTNPAHKYQLPLLYYKNWFEGDRKKTPDYDNDRPYLLWFYGNYAEPTNPNEGGVGIQIYDPITNFRQRKGFPLAWMVLYDDFNVYSDFQANLSFSKEGYSHSVITSFHQRDLERQAQNVRVEGYIDWSNIDVFNLDFKRKYVINQVPYILKKIDGYNPATGTTTKTVLQIDSRIMADDDNITNTQNIDSDLKGLIII